ncbi:MAG: hypothetical protein MJ146_01440 [Clostridia bacterium]|nr:hypothetical protein [Clostridia bacterium]
MKKRLIAILLTVTLVLTYMPMMAFAKTSNEYKISTRYPGVFTTIEYWFNDNANHQTIKDGETITNIPTGCALHIKATITDDYSFDKNDSSVQTKEFEFKDYRGDGVFDEDLYKVKEYVGYDLPSGAIITDEQGNPVNSADGQNWAVTDRGGITGHALNIYGENLVLSGKYNLPTYVHAKKITLKNLKFNGYFEPRNDEGLEVVLQGDNVVSSIYMEPKESGERVGDITFTGSGTMSFESIWLKNATVDGPSLESKYEYPILDVDKFEVKSGKVHLKYTGTDTKGFMCVNELVVAPGLYVTEGVQVVNGELKVNGKPLTELTIGVEKAPSKPKGIIETVVSVVVNQINAVINTVMKIIENIFRIFR